MHRLTKAALRRRKKRRLVTKPARHKMKLLTKEMADAAIADRPTTNRG